VTLTDRVSRLSGTVTHRSARPVSNALVVIFPTIENDAAIAHRIDPIRTRLATKISVRPKKTELQTALN
jgi:hypothetical protein